MKVTIWHNPKCATSRKVLDLIRANGHEPELVAYVASPPSISDIKAVLKTRPGNMHLPPVDVPNQVQYGLGLDLEPVPA